MAPIEMVPPKCDPEGLYGLLIKLQYLSGVATGGCLVPIGISLTDLSAITTEASLVRRLIVSEPQCSFSNAALCPLTCLSELNVAGRYCPHPFHCHLIHPILG